MNDQSTQIKVPFLSEYLSRKTPWDRSQSWKTL